MAKHHSSSSPPPSAAAHSSLTSPPSVSQLSMQLKQDLAMLAHKDPDTRRSSMEALKQFIEGELDIRSMPGFLEQVSGETGKSSGSYAISLFVEVARVHKEATVPFIPRIMAAVLRTLASSSGGAGHANNLHQSCGKVVASVARYAIKPTCGVGRSISAADILDSLCQPLLGLLSSNVEPVAVGSATCLQGVIETENWKLAAPELVHDVCSRSSISLIEKGKYSVAHMHLVRSLAKFNAGALQDYAGSLLKVGVLVLVTIGGSTPGCGSWQQRAAAAQLLGTIIGCVDYRALGLELVSTTKALENCRLDKVATVRQAVGEALSVAKSIAFKVDPLLLHDGGSESNLANSSPTKSKLHEPRKRGVRKRNLSKAEELHGSTISANDIVVVSQESQCVSYASSPSSSITSISSSSLRSPSPPPTEKSNVRIGHSSLYPAKQSPVCPPSSIDKYMAETDVPYILANAKSSDFKENTPFAAKVEDGLGVPKPDDLGYLVYSNGNKIPKESDNDDFMMGTIDEHAYTTDVDCDYFMAGEYVEVDTLEADSCCEKDAGINGWGKVLEVPGKDVTSKHVVQRHETTFYNPGADKSLSKNSKLVANVHGKLYAEKQQNVSCPQVAKNSMSAEDFLIFSTPRRLVRSLQSMSTTPESKCSPERDQGLDLDCETLSESGWSVRDNPIAGYGGEDSPRHSSVHGQGDMLTRSLEGPYLMGLLNESQASNERVIQSSEFANVINVAWETSIKKACDTGSDVDKNVIGCSTRLTHESQNRTEEEQTSGLYKSRKSRNWSRWVSVLGKIHFYVERLLFGTLLLVLAFAIFITILSCKGPHDLHRLVPT